MPLPCPNHRARPRLALMIAAALGALLCASPAHAHQVGLSRGEYTRAGEWLRARLTFAQADAIELVAGLDHDADGKLSLAEIDVARELLLRALIARVKVTAQGARCPAELGKVVLDEQDGLALEASFHCPAPSPALDVQLSMLGDLPSGHRHLARALAGDLREDHVLSAEQRSFSIEALPAPAPTTTSPRGPWAIFAMGIEHILTGYDHLVFLLGLVLVGGRLRALLLVVTAFTVAHSITLGLSVLGVLAPSTRLVEPLIALSIAYVGVENFFVNDASKRWRITLPFGLIHGFGFASALGEINLPKGEIPAALLSFNLGVEAGQIAVLAVVLPFVVLASRRPALRDKGKKAMSALIIAAGLAWFAARVSGA